nr:hypothetical protein [Aneurinibacillus sp. XH2]
MARHELPQLDASSSDVLPQPDAQAELEHMTPNRERARYGYDVGSIVWIGADEYEVAQLESQTVVLQDRQFPLFIKEWNRRDFERMLRENPLNDHLITGELEPGLTNEEGWEPVAEEDVSSTRLNDEQEQQTKQANVHSPTQASDRPATPAVNYRITDDELGHGGAKTKFKWNIEAIRLLNKLEKEQRQATAEEQAVLARYVGWGGLPQAFDEANTQWAAEYAELRELLEPEEYASARASTLNAHYTSPIVIKAMYDCLESMGFRSGNILEPSCGIGHFFGMVPESFQDSKCRH